MAEQSFPRLELRSWLDEDDFNAGYLVRAADKLPRRGPKSKWALTQDYWTERRELPALDFKANEFIFS